MRNRTLVSIFIACFLIAGCVAPPAEPAVQDPAEPAAATATSIVAPAAATPTTTTLPLPQPQPSLIVADTPIPFSLPAIGSVATGVSATPKDGAVNCRGGPDIIWPIGAHLDPGQSTEVVGRNGDSSWWYVRNPTSPENFCWVSGLYVTVTGSTAGLKEVFAIGTPNVNGTPYGTITALLIILEPQEISAPGCGGPIPPIKVFIKITTSGPIQIKWHLEGDEIPNTSSRKLTFDRGDIQDVTESFTPPINDGTHRIYFMVDDMQLNVNNAASYTIYC